MDSFDVIKCLDDYMSNAKESVSYLIDKIEHLQITTHMTYFQEAYNNLCVRVGNNRTERANNLREYYSSKRYCFQRNDQNSVKKTEKCSQTKQRQDSLLLVRSAYDIQKLDKDFEVKPQQCADKTEKNQCNIDFQIDRVECKDNIDESVCNQESPKVRSMTKALRSLKKWFSGKKIMKRKKSAPAQELKASKTKPSLHPHLYLDFNHRLSGYEPTSLPGIMPLQLDTNPSVFLVKK